MVALAAVGWGTWPLFLRQAERGGAIPPALEAAVAMAAYTLASACALVRDRLGVRATPWQWTRIALLGVADALNIVFFFAAYQRTHVSIAVLTHYATPMLVALGAPLLALEPWRARTFLAVGVSLAGLVLLLEPWSVAARPSDGAGALLGLASAGCYAFNVLVSKGLVPVFSGAEMGAYHGAISVLVLACLVPNGGLSSVLAPSAGWLLAGALLPGATAGLLFIWGLRRIRASHASILTFLEPLVATVLGSVALHERVAPLGMLGGALILTGGAVAVTSPGAARPSRR
jgi:DME family drug/metabolite transporter